MIAIASELFPSSSVFSVCLSLRLESLRDSDPSINGAIMKGDGVSVPNRAIGRDNHQILESIDSEGLQTLCDI